jgi:hypothetical protein
VFPTIAIPARVTLAGIVTTGGREPGQCFPWQRVSCNQGGWLAINDDGTPTCDERGRRIRLRIGRERPMRVALRAQRRHFRRAWADGSLRIAEEAPSGIIWDYFGETTRLAIGVASASWLSLFTLEILREEYGLEPFWSVRVPAVALLCLGVLICIAFAWFSAVRLRTCCGFTPIQRFQITSKSMMLEERNGIHRNYSWNECEIEPYPLGMKLRTADGLTHYNGSASLRTRIRLGTILVLREPWLENARRTSIRRIILWTVLGILLVGASSFQETLDRRLAEALTRNPPRDVANPADTHPESSAPCWPQPE